MMSGADYRDAPRVGQARERLFYFVVVIDCFCIDFYKEFCLFSRFYRRFFVSFFDFLSLFVKRTDFILLIFVDCRVYSGKMMRG